MQKPKFRNLIAVVANKLLALTDTKGEEYANSADQLANFKRQGLENDLPPEAILMVYFNKHIDSIKSFTKQLRTKEVGQITESEPIEGRIDDAILYLLLLRGLVMERRDPDLRELTHVSSHPKSMLGWMTPRSAGIDSAYDSPSPVKMEIK